MSCEFFLVYEGCVVNTNNCSIVAYGHRPKNIGTEKEASPASPSAISGGSPAKSESVGSPAKAESVGSPVNVELEYSPARN